MNFDTIKPFRVIVLAAFALVAVVGLFMFARFKGFDNGQNAIGSVLIWGTLPESGMTGELNVFKKAHPEFVNVSYVAKSPATFGSDLAEALAVAQGPDMVLISQEQLVSQTNKLSVIPYSSISQREFRDTFVPINELYLTDKGTYGIPFVVDPLVMYYNRTLLSSAGIPQPPNNWEAVLGMSDRLTQRTAGQVTRSLLAFGEYDNVPNARGILSLLLLQAGTPISQTENGKLVSALTRGPNTEGSSAAASALSFYTQFSDPAKTVYSWNSSLPDARQAFLGGDLALYFGYASELPQISAGNPNLDFDMAPVPQPSRNTSRTTYGLAYAFAIPKTSKNPTGAYAAAVALAAQDVELPAANALSMVPAARAGLIPAPENRFQPVYFPEALVAHGWLSPSPSVTDSIFAAMIRDITSGRSDVGEALTTANNALNSAL
jgi:ABC-type glycerol-3-phosphate transport system substrate-binding protein